MAFFKFRNRGQQANEGRGATMAAAPAESVESMRRRARHRLVGAAVLVLVGVVGFPLLFDTQPRPIAVDIPIEIPDRSKAKPLPLPSTPATAPTTSAAPPNQAPSPPSASAQAPTTPGRPANDSMITESADGIEIAPSRPMAAAPPAETRPQAAAQPKPPAVEAKQKPETKTEVKPESKTAVAKPSSSDDAARARALLEGKTAAAKPVAPAPTNASTAPAAADDSGRFVIQVGAFADADKAREVRQRLDKAGLKSYTQVAKTSDGERTRVRVGPFASRAEADKAASRIKGLSLSASVLTL